MKKIKGKCKSLKHFYQRQIPPIHTGFNVQISSPQHSTSTHVSGPVHMGRVSPDSLHEGKNPHKKLMQTLSAADLIQVRIQIQMPWQGQ